LDTRLKNYNSFSHSIYTKIIVFIIVITCFTGALNTLFKIAVKTDGDFGIVAEEDYFQSESYIRESEMLVSDLTMLIGEYKSEEHILSGATISPEELKNTDDNLFFEFRDSAQYNHEISEAENYEKFKETYATQLAEARENLIEDDLRVYHRILEDLEDYKEPFYYASDGVNVYTNQPGLEKEQIKTDDPANPLSIDSKQVKEQFKTYPSFMLFDGFKNEFFPEKIKQNKNLFRITDTKEGLDPGNSTIYVAFSQKYLNQKINDWQESKSLATQSLSTLGVFLAGLILSFIYLLVVTGRNSFKDEEVHLNLVDKLNNDINLVLCFGLIIGWFFTAEALFEIFEKFLISVTIPIASVGLMLVLSLVKHIKKRTFFKHTVIYSIFHKLFGFASEVYANGNVAVKTVLIVIGYPILIAVTFFIFPITIGVAAWFALKKIKTFKAIQEGVEKIKAGDLQHRIEAGDKGEFARLATNINSITDGLKNSVDSELKSERMKTELITNVSHDIRTPLTSIITYVDLLKIEKDPAKIAEYIEVLEQKSKRLKVLTDDLFDAAKASSGNIPVQLERIDVVSLVTQGLGEVSDKIEAMNLDFKLSHPQEKLYVAADGKLLWRSIENLLSNIFKYALRESRVYIVIEDLGNDVLLTFKNISAYELNISEDELMERFKRGDESRSSQGSGLGLSIAKSLVEIQNGRFAIQIDGDLFKAMIYMPKFPV
jgi:signal transduction histidine kinase